MDIGADQKSRLAVQQFGADPQTIAQRLDHHQQQRHIHPGFAPIHRAIDFDGNLAQCTGGEAKDLHHGDGIVFEDMLRGGCLRSPGDTAALTLTVGCGAEPASGTAELSVPAGITLTAAPDLTAPDLTAPDLAYDLAPGGYAAWDLTVRAAPGTAAGRYFVAARIRDQFGHLTEDTVMVAVGEPRWPDPDLSAEETLERMQDDYRAGAAEVDPAMLPPELHLAPGGHGELLVLLTNQLASELHGEAQLVSPFGTWPLLGPWTRGFSVAPRASTTLRFAVTVPATERPGSQWWALVKVMYFGRVRYTEAIPVIISAGDIGPGN